MNGIDLQRSGLTPLIAFAICKAAREEITQRHLSVRQHGPGLSTAGRAAPTIAEEGITKVITELGDRLESLEMQRKRQEQPREVLDAQVRVISAAQNRWDLKNISAGEDTSQYMVSNSDAVFSADNVRAGNRTMQTFGKIDAASLQQLSANHTANMQY